MTETTNNNRISPINRNFQSSGEWEKTRQVSIPFVPASVPWRPCNQKMAISDSLPTPQCLWANQGVTPMRPWTCPSGGELYPACDRSHWPSPVPRHTCCWVPPDRPPVHLCWPMERPTVSVLVRSCYNVRLPFGLVQPGPYRIAVEERNSLQNIFMNQ